MPKKKLLPKLFEHGVFAGVIELFKTAFVWASPFMLAAITAAAGYAVSVPLFIIVPVVAICFAATMTGILRFDEWRSRRSPENKFVYDSLTLGASYTRNKKTGRPEKVTKTQVIFNFRNLGPFPISFVIDEIQTSIDGRMNPHPKYHTKGGMAGAQSKYWFRDDIIDMQSADLKQVMEGTAKIRLRYGRPGNEKFKLEKSLNLACSLDAKTGGYLHPMASDAPQQS